MQEAAQQRPEVLCAARLVKVNGRRYNIDPSGEVHEKVCWLRRCWRYCFGSREAGRREEHVAGILEQARATLSAQAARGWSGKDSARARVHALLGTGEHSGNPQSPPSVAVQFSPQYPPQPYQGHRPSTPSESSLGSPPHSPPPLLTRSESPVASMGSAGSAGSAEVKSVTFSDKVEVHEYQPDEIGTGDDTPAGQEEDPGEGTSSGTGGDGSSGQSSSWRKSLKKPPAD